MAVLTRAAIIAKINAFITTNGNKEITGAQLNEILQNISDSGFMQLDEIRTALSTSYAAGNFLDWPVLPLEVKAALDTLAASVSTNPSDDVAYISETGSDITGEVGNPLKPFATFAIALDALPPSNCSIVALGGSYTDDIVLNLLTNKTNFTLELKGITLNGSIVVSSSCSNIGIDLEGSTITSNIVGSSISFAPSGDSYILGGTVVNQNASGLCLSGGGSGGIKTVIGTSFTSQNNGVRDGSFFTFINCNIVSQSIAASRLQDSKFYGGSITSITSVGYRSSNTANVLYNVDIKGTTGAQGENALMGYFYGCRIEGVNYGLLFSQSSNEFFAKDCDFIGGIDCILYNSNISRLVTTNHVFQNCKLYAGSGAIFNEPTYAGGDLGNTQVINCTYNKAFTPAVAPQKIFEYNKVEITGLQQPLK